MAAAARESRARRRYCSRSPCSGSTRHLGRCHAARSLRVEAGLPPAPRGVSEGVDRAGRDRGRRASAGRRWRRWRGSDGLGRRPIFGEPTVGRTRRARSPASSSQSRGTRTGSSRSRLFVSCAPRSSRARSPGSTPWSTWAGTPPRSSTATTRSTSGSRSCSCSCSDSSFLLLTLAFRSIVVPATAIGMNLLSVGAAYGLLVLVFRGHRQ